MTIRESAFRLENDVGLPIRCDLRRPEGDGPFPAVVVLHGFKGFKDWGMFPPTARRLAERGLAVVSMNASMNGVGEDLLEFTELEKFARNTPQRAILDLERVIDAVEAGDVDPTIDPSRLGRTTLRTMVANCAVCSIGALSGKKTSTTNWFRSDLGKKLDGIGSISIKAKKA